MTENLLIDVVQDLHFVSVGKGDIKN